MSRADLSRAVLSRRVFWRTLSATLLVAVVALLVHAALLLDRQRTEALRAVDSTLDLLLPNFANAAWQINEGVMRSLLDSMAATRDVRWVRYEDAHQQQVAPRQADTGAPCPQRIERRLAGTPVGPQVLDGGSLTLCYGPPGWVAMLAPQLWQTLIPLLLLAVAAVYPAFMIRRTVLRPIEALTRGLRDEASVLDIELDRPQADRGDEVDRLLDELKQRTRRFLQERGMAELAFQALQDGIVITDERCVVLRANPAVARLLNHGARLVPGAPLADHVPPSALLSLEQPVEFQTTEGRTIEAVCTRVEQSGERVRLAFLFSDLTLRRQYESNLLQSHKMNALGTLSGGVAHDFNNLLMAISGNAELLGMGENLSDDGKAMVAAIRHAARRGAGLTAQLLTFARKQPLKPALLDVAAVCQEVLSLSRRTLGASHRLQLTVEPGLRVRADATFLETALLNLLVNARDAQPDGGPIGLSAEAVLIDGADMVRLAVVNGGPAIDPEVLAHMGEPFFTTKANGKGTGLGLSMVLGFAQQSGGRVAMASEPGRTCMALVLPREVGEPQAPEDAPSAPASGGSRRSLQVLVVDDDPLVLKVSGALLASLGHWVTPVSSPGQVDLLLRGGQRWDLVVCDVVLEDGNGLDVHAVLQRHGHSPAVVFVSGNVPAALQERIAQTDALAVLHKPFDRETLRGLIDQVSVGAGADGRADGRPDERPS